MPKFSHLILVGRTVEGDKTAFMADDMISYFLPTRCWGGDLKRN
jgi:hypothetical protein